MTSQRFTALEVRQASGVDDVAYLGTGSFGETWRVGQEAWKLLYRPGYDVERLAREVSGLERVASSCVVKLLRTDSIELSGAEYPLLVFEHIPGISLQQFMDTGVTGVPDASFISFVDGLLCGLDALHSANVIHRDIKPENIALRNADIASPVILDLGLAKLLDVDSITRYPTLVGNALYAAPEQLRGERALRASDLWAVGVIVYQLTFNAHPYFTVGESLNLGQALTRQEQLVVPSTSSDTLIGNFMKRALAIEPHQRGSVKAARRRLKESV